MTFKSPESEQLRLSKGLINPMEVRTMKNNYPAFPRKDSYTTTNAFVERRKMDYQRSFSQGHGRKMFSSKSYFSLESLFILVCLAASLLVLPLILPPLPPPPFMLLLLPLCLLAVLVFLAFMPSNVRDVTTYTYA